MLPELPLVCADDCGLFSSVPGSYSGVEVSVVFPTRDSDALPPNVKPPAGVKYEICGETL